MIGTLIALALALLSGKPETRESGNRNMPTTYIWNGATSGDWATAANFSPSGLPATGDTVHLPMTALNNITTNLDRTGDGTGAGLHLAELIRPKGSTVQIGTASVPLRCTAEKILDEGSAAFFYSSETGSAGETTERVIINHESGATHTVSLGGDGGYGRIELFAGRIELDHDTLPIEQLIAIDLRNSLVIEQTNDGSIVLAQILGGSADLSAVQTVHMNFGELTISRGDTQGNVETLWQTGGSVLYNGTNSLTTPLGDPVVYSLAGLFDASRASSGAGLGTIYVSPAAEFKTSPFLNVTGSIIYLGE